MESTTPKEAKQFRSPQHKLVRFFERSRDQWKEKCKEAKQRCKRLSTQVRAVEKSRQRWRAEAEAAITRLQEVEQLLANQKRELASR